jgi:pimeloyl-ACP methyl ester carboxylesterase
MTEPLILVPGLMCDEAVWAQQFEVLGAGRPVHIASHGLSDTIEAMAERILSNAAPRFALAGHSMGGRVALEVMARAPERVSRLALLDTGYEPLASGEPGQREKAGRLRLLAIAQRDGMLPMAHDWARGMVHPDRLADASLMDAIHSIIARAGVALPAPAPNVFPVRAITREPVIRHRGHQHQRPGHDHRDSP